jgi:hypothetical protein
MADNEICSLYIGFCNSLLMHTRSTENKMRLSVERHSCVSLVSVYLWRVLNVH